MAKGRRPRSEPDAAEMPFDPPADNRVYGAGTFDGDPRFHIERINDWVGSDSYVEGGDGTPREYIPPAGPRLPYRLLRNATDRDGNWVRAGSYVEIYAEELGEHHAMIEGVDYSAHGVLAHAAELVEEVKVAHPEEFAEEKEKVEAEASEDDKEDG
jgi:hypothetical protein